MVRERASLAVAAEGVAEFQPADGGATVQSARGRAGVFDPGTTDAHSEDHARADAVVGHAPRATGAAQALTAGTLLGVAAGGAEVL